MPGSEIDYRHFLPKQNTISQMNHTAMNSSIWTTSSQSLSVFKILKFAAQFLIFLDTLLICDARARSGATGNNNEILCEQNRKSTARIPLVLN